jgi:hypothetical protein
VAGVASFRPIFGIWQNQRTNEISQAEKKEKEEKRQDFVMRVVVYEYKLLLG